VAFALVDLEDVHVGDGAEHEQHEEDGCDGDIEGDGGDSAQGGRGWGIGRPRCGGSRLCPLIRNRKSFRSIEGGLAYRSGHLNGALVQTSSGRRTERKSVKICWNRCLD
jgi:hypothetical protein